MKKNILKSELGMVYRLNRNNLVNAKRIKSKINSYVDTAIYVKEKVKHRNVGTAL